MIRETSLVIVSFFCGTFVTGCATIMHGTVQEIPVSSSPTGATVLVDDGLRFKTPTTLVLSRKDSHKLEFSMEGHETSTVEVKPSASAAMAGNILFGGLVGIGVDGASGAAYTLIPEVVHVDLVPVPIKVVASPTADVDTTEPTEKPDAKESNP